MRRVGSVLKGVLGSAERNMVDTSDGWFVLAMILSLALPVALLEVLYISEAPALPFEVLLFGLGLAIAGFYAHLCEKRWRDR